MTRSSSRGWGTSWLVASCLASIMMAGTASAAEPAVATRGVARFHPAEGEPQLDTRFQLPAHEFAYELTPFPKVSERIALSTVTFPSPVVTASPENNTVHCEYYQPNVPGKVPAVIVLHILGGDFPLARVFSNAIAQRGTAALFLKMPYYGPRRPPNSPKRMISRDPEETVEGMTQAILDIRRAAAFLASREEIDAGELGVFGISLGGITGALALTAEPRLKNGCLLLAGGDMAQIAWSSRELEATRQYWLERGGTKESFFDVMRAIDPVTYAAQVQGRRVLMLNATDDEVIPRSCTESLWKAV
ncbi:MAG: alpha/beta hydrolase family protein, partial [Pirellulaceae bacterium]